MTRKSPRPRKVHRRVRHAQPAKLQRYARYNEERRARVWSNSQQFFWGRA